MNMLEFVTVKDNILKFLKTHQNDVMDSDIINNHVKFFSQPKGVIPACIDEMVMDKSIKILEQDNKYILTLSEKGERLLTEGGYVNKLIEEKKLREKKSDNARATNASYNRKKQITILANTVNALSVLLSILFKKF